MTPNQYPATIVPDNERLDFLPKLVKSPNYILRLESYVYGFADHYYENYRGGFWDFYDVPGAGFLALRTDSPVIHLGILDNYFEEDVSPETAGIITTLYALNTCIAIAHSRHDLNAQQHITDTYYALYDWALNGTHPDAVLIARAID